MRRTAQDCAGQGTRGRGRPPPGTLFERNRENSKVWHAGPPWAEATGGGGFRPFRPLEGSGGAGRRPKRCASSRCAVWRRRHSNRPSVARVPAENVFEPKRARSARVVLVTCITVFRQRCDENVTSAKRHLEVTQTTRQHLCGHFRIPRDEAWLDRPAATGSSCGHRSIPSLEYASVTRLCKSVGDRRLSSEWTRDATW